VTSTAGTDAPAGLDTGALVRRSIITFLCMIGIAAAFTVLFFSMRSVMDIGGRCFSGNVGIDPNVVTQCPEGVPGLMIGSIFGGLILIAIYAFNAIGPNLTLLAWPVLFLSLGWNFLEYAFSPPDGGEGIVWGWLICGVLFVLMGGLPLVFGIKFALDGKESRISQLQARRRSVANRYGRGGTEVPATRTVWVYGLVLQLVAMAVGIWVGIELFEWATDSVIRFG
jgi:hypothetical protein